MWAGAALLLGCKDNLPLDPATGIEPRAAAQGSQRDAPYLSATAVSSSAIKLAWEDNSVDESGFEIHRSYTGEDGTFFLIARLPADDSLFIDSWLTKGATYHYAVRSFRLPGTRGKRTVVYSAFSNTACATTYTGQSASCPPPAPSAAPDIATRPIRSHIVIVEWIRSGIAGSVDSIRVYRSNDDGAHWAQIGPPVSVGYSYMLDGGVESERRVCHRITVFNIAGETAPSNMACTTPPAGPTNLVATHVDEQTVDLTWDDNSAVEDGYYVVERRLQPLVCDEEGDCYDPCGGFGSCEEHLFIAALPANATTFRTGPVIGEFYVSARKDGGESDPSNRVR